MQEKHAEKINKLKSLLKPPKDYRDWEFTMIVFGRPTSFLFVYPITDIKFITPNLITMFAAICGFIASGLIVWAQEWTILISVLLFLRMVLDDADGMLARYRNHTTFFGFYLDNLLDLVGFFALFTALGYRAYEQSGNILYIIIASLSSFSTAVLGYVKWIQNYLEIKKHGLKKEDNQAHNIKNSISTKHFFLKLFLKILMPMESDIFTITIICILLSRYDILCYVILLIQISGSLIQMIRRGMAIRTLDMNN